MSLTKQLSPYFSTIATAMAMGHQIMSKEGLSKTAILEATVAGHFSPADCTALLTLAQQDKVARKSANLADDRSGLRGHFNREGLSDVCNVTHNKGDNSVTLAIDGVKSVTIPAGKVGDVSDVLDLVFCALRMTGQIEQESDEDSPPSLSVVNG